MAATFDASSRRPAGGSDHAPADRLWAALRREAGAALRAEPELTALIWPVVLARTGFEDAVAYRVSSRLDCPFLSGDTIRDGFAEALAADPAIGAGLRRDANAVIERDPAVERLLDPVLYFKGFHALQAHRLAHWLWSVGRRDFALSLQSRASEVFQVDIHPGARIGSGVMLDHATGFIAGETVVIEDDVSILHGVVLGGTGTGRGDRHPKIRHGSMLGAGAQIFGAIEVGACSRVAAGSLVVHDVPPCATVAGVPARVVGSGGSSEPSRVMDQQLNEAAYTASGYVI
ncbi:serine O-acetyltransferase [Enterovirga rhinocerotis]|uniref:Serine acetyltransferase n=1 Tax=Enterovirga rhinocerotis TaxID=1339210 RepID=A0A4R7BIV1_9HYPH|nr:serine O-acetyltransferase [Enterovirga rhinocerotis]TDR85260.1 serine O-acetyltransferase [Enterovirga rhinocerotis]